MAEAIVALICIGFFLFMVWLAGPKGGKSDWQVEMERRQFLDLERKLYAERNKSEAAYNRWASFERRWDEGPFAGAWGDWWKNYLPEAERELSPEVVKRLQKLDI